MGSVLKSVFLIFGFGVAIAIFFFLPISGPMLILIGLVLMYNRDHKQVDHGWRNPPAEPVTNVYHTHINKNIFVVKEPAPAVPQVKTAEVSADWRKCD